MAKYLYVKQKCLDLKSNWGTEIYRIHLEHWNHFFEEAPKKRTFHDFITAFDELIESVQSNSIDIMNPVPVYQKSIITNGAHRTAVGLFLKLPIPCSDTESYVSFPYTMFLKKQMPTKYMEALVLEYIQLKPSTIIHLSIKEPYVDEQKIVYQKKIRLFTHGRNNLEVYLPNHSIKKHFNANQFFYLTIIDDENFHSEEGVTVKTRQEIKKTASFFLHPFTFYLWNYYPLPTLQLTSQMDFLQYLKELQKIQDDSSFCLSQEFTSLVFKEQKGALSYYKFKSVKKIRNFKLMDVQNSDDIIFHPDNHFYIAGIKFAKIPELLRL